MPSFISLLFNKQASCSCECHSEQETTLMRPSSWLSKLTRRSSSTSSTMTDDSYISTESDMDEKKLNDFTILFDVAVDEVHYY
jgi:hypothetical protein